MEPIGRVKLIATGSAYPVRKYGEEKFNLLVPVKIADIAIAYCGADPEINSSSFIECARLLLQKFGGVGIDEVKEAFAMAAAKKFGEEIDLTSYKGVFTVAMFGDVMSEYVSYRNRVLAEMQRISEAEERERKEEIKRQKFEIVKKQVIEKFNAMRFDNREISKVGDVPGWWAKVLKDHGLINGDPAAWILAKKRTCEIFIQEYKDRVNDLMFSTMERARIVSEIEADENHFPAQLKDRAEVLYGRILIFNQLAKFNDL